MAAKPRNCRFLVGIGPASAKNDRERNLEAETMTNVFKPQERAAHEAHGFNGLVVHHGPEESVPVLWLLLYEVQPVRDVGQCAVDVKNNCFHLLFSDHGLQLRLIASRRRKNWSAVTWTY